MAIRTLNKKKDVQRKYKMLEEMYEGGQREENSELEKLTEKIYY